MIIPITQSVWDFEGHNDKLLAKLFDDSDLNASIVIEADKHGLNEHYVVCRRTGRVVELWSRK